MASNQKVTNIQNALAGAGYVTSAPASGTPWPLKGPYNLGQLTELTDIFKAGGAQVSLQNLALPTITLTPAATLTGHLVITQTMASFLRGEFISVSVGDAAGDTLACVVTGAGTKASPWLIAITLANTTDSKNTLGLIDSLMNITPGVGDNTGTATQVAGSSIIETAVFGTSTPRNAQLVHGGTNTLAATALTNSQTTTLPGTLLLTDLT